MSDELLRKIAADIVDMARDIEAAGKCRTGLYELTRDEAIDNAVIAMRRLQQQPLT